MKIIGLTEAKDKLSSVIEDAKNNPTIIIKNGKTAALLIVPEDDLDLERLLLLKSQILQDVLRERRNVTRSTSVRPFRSRRRFRVMTQGDVNIPLVEKGSDLGFEIATLELSHN